MVLEMELKEEIVEKGNEYLDEVERDLKQIASIRNEIIKKRKSVDGHCSIMVQGFEKLYILIRGNLTSFSKTLGILPGIFINLFSYLSLPTTSTEVS